MNKRILVIDDDPAIGGLIRDLLEFDKFEIIISHIPEDGLFNARYKTPSVIILDLFLPNMNGFELYKQLKQDDRTKDIPVIVITGHTDTPTINMMKELGLSGVFYKPFHFAHLRKKILVLTGNEEKAGVVCKVCGRGLEDTWEYCPFDGWNRK